LLLFLTTEKLKEIVEDAKIRPLTPTLASGQPIIHTPASDLGNKEEWDNLNNSVLSIITACLNNSQEAHISQFKLASEV
jgi:hypothetical protein